ncbi:hypothetical protein ACJ41O_014428 [Fusarium nematophilum]
MFLVANAVALSAGVGNVNSFIRRSGLISVINLVPLFLGGQMNIIASRCGIGLRAYTRIHRWLGAVAIIEGLLHAIVSVSRQIPDLKRRTDVAGIVVLSIFLTIPPSGLLRRRLYEAFLTLHFTLSWAVLAAVYLHAPTNTLASPTVFLFAAVRLVLFTGRASVRTITFKRSTGEDILLSDAVHLHIRLSRRWRHRAGQYVYLCMPGVSHTSFAQLHPFYVAWWYRDGGDDYAVLIIQKKRGFTDRVFSHRVSEFDKGADLAAVIEGPYGKELHLDSYGTVLLFATGIGIAVQTAWVADRMQQLLKQDTGRILDIHIHVLGNFLSSVTDQGDYVQLGERIDMTYGPLRVREVIDNEMKQRKGRTVISLCADDRISDEIRNLVQSMTHDKISLKELDFRPEVGTIVPRGNLTAT